MANYRNSFAEINLRALKDNYRFLLATLQKSNPQGRLIPMVKADAYGHGDVRVAQALHEVEVPFLGVALVEEGIKLRNHGIRVPILVFGQVDAISAEELIKFDLIPVLSTFGQIESLKNHLPEGAEYPVHLKFNTGMQRLGFEPEEVTHLTDVLKASSRLQVAGVCTHLVASEDFENPQGHSRNQIQMFSEIEGSLRTQFKNGFLSHVCNSGGILNGAAPHSDLARPGISLYGYAPSKSLGSKGAGLTPVMTVKSQIAFMHKIKKGTSVSYGGTWKAPVDSVIGVIPMGYADGVPRVMSNKGSILVRGQKVPITGTVCMDYFMVDLTKVPQPQIGEEVVLIGEQNGAVISADDWAGWVGSISYEILTGIQSRVPRFYVEG